MASFGQCLRVLANYKHILIVLLTPAILSPLLQDSWHIIKELPCDPTCETGCTFNNETETWYQSEEKRPYKCLFALIIMATYWTAEVTPLAVTSLIPMFMFPMLGILPAARTSAHYFKDVNFLFFGGLIVAIAIEKCNLHLRIALSVMKLAGSKLHNLMAAFMATTAFLSMWISNTATTAMMLPIAVATVKTVTGEDQISEETRSENSDPEAEQNIVSDVEMGVVNSDNSLSDGFNPQGVINSAGSLTIPNQKTAYHSVGQVDMSFNSMDQMNKGKGGYAAAVPKKRKPKSNENTKVLMKAMLLAVAYAANIGGIGTLIGTPVNLILQTQMETVCENNLNKDTPDGVPANELNFLSWMYFALPVSIVCNIGCWLWLIAVYMGPSKVWADIKKRHETPEDIRVKDMIRKKYDDLGKPSYEEWVVGFHFVTLAILWFTRSPKFISGWQAAFEPGHVKDSTAALAICFSLFLWPSKPNFLNFVRGARYESDGQNMPKPASPILDWKTCQKTLAWDVIILLGAGFALADACQSSDLSELLGQTIGSMMGSINAKFLPFLISLMISFITGFTSNTSTASVFIPIIASLCVELNLNPLYLCIPVTFACSFAFILPIATPPNAIAFSYGYLETVDMIKVGTLLNILCVLVTAMLLPIVAFPAYSLGEFPAWAVMNADGAGDVLVNATMTTLDVVAST
jgi:sodium-dependent dicarboxylate transporter 2/3/5